MRFDRREEQGRRCDVREKKCKILSSDVRVIGCFSISPTNTCQLKHREQERQKATADVVKAVQLILTDVGVKVALVKTLDQGLQRRLRAVQLFIHKDRESRKRDNTVSM
jgi:hypothetical protein